MGMNKRQRWAIGSAVVAVGALVADQLDLIPGPASASAAALAESELPRIVTTDDLVALASKLQDVCEAAPAWGAASMAGRSARDPFESPWKVIEAAASTGNDPAPAETPSSVRVLPDLTAIVSAGGRGYAVLDGKPLGLGASRDGYTLVDLTAEAATISVDGAVFTLPLRDRKIVP